MTKIILTASFAASKQAARLRETLADANFVTVDGEGNPTEGSDLSDAEIFLRWWSPRQVSERVVAQAARLRWLHTPSAGLDHVLFPALVERDITVTNSSGVHAIPISEWVIAFMLMAAKRIPELLIAQQERRWADGLKLTELSDKTLLVAGYGAIGQEVARRAGSFGMRVVASRSGSGRQREEIAGVEVVSGEGWRDRLPEADFVAICLPLTDATRHAFNAATLALMQPTAWLINIARGEIVDEDALLAALREERIGGAALDAFAEEPLPSDHPLYDFPTSRVIITPHHSWNSPQVQERTVDLFIENYRRFVAGDELRNVVNKQAGYLENFHCDPHPNASLVCCYRHTGATVVGAQERKVEGAPIIVR